MSLMGAESLLARRLRVVERVLCVLTDDRSVEKEELLPELLPVVGLARSLANSFMD